MDTLVRSIAERFDGSRRLIVAIAGPPGAGKSTLAEALGKGLNAALPGAPAEVVPMDGYHYDNAILTDRGLLARKGAPETFDIDGFLALIRRLRTESGDIAIPVFDRSIDLARGSARIVRADHRILVVEGNYLLLERPVWRDLAPLFDFRVFLRPTIATIEERLIRRWLDNGLATDAAIARARGNDLVNAKVVLAESRDPDLTVEN